MGDTARETMVVPVRKYACGTLDCKYFGLVKSPDIWPAACCGEFIWPHITCDGCGQDFETASERNEEILYGWVPGIAQEDADNAGPLRAPGETQS